MTDATQLAARGVPITLADGTTVTLRYSFRSISLLEEFFGSLARVQQALERESALMREGAKRVRLYRVLQEAIGPGLVHVRTTDPDTGERCRLGERPDLVGDLLDPARARAYIDAWTAAMTEAFGELYGRALPDTSADPQVPQETAAAPATTVRSPGQTGTTSPSSSQAEATSGSGA